MKKSKSISLLLSLVLLLQCLLVPVYATETETSADAAELTEAAAVEETTAAKFGTECIESGCRTIEGKIPLGGYDRKLATALAAFCYEVTTGTVIYSYNPDMKLPTGTLSKIVLALVVIENCELDEVVTCIEGIQSYVPSTALRMEPYLKSGEQMTVKDLLYALLMESKNDAAVALAMHVSGTTNACTELMNKRAKQIGCTNTEFGNISGLDTAESYTTARDMARIMQEAYKNETFVEISGTATYTIGATNMVESERKLVTTNYLIDNRIVPQFYDKRVICGLPSFTENSGAGIACVASNVSESNPHGLTIVCVTMGGSRTYNDTGTTNLYGNFDEVLELINFAFNNYKINRIVYDGMSMYQWPVSGGESKVVGEARTNIDSVVPSTAKMDNMIMKYTVVGGGLSAPVNSGDMIATVSVWFRNSCLTEVEIFAMNNVKAMSTSGVDIRSNDAEAESGGSKLLSTIGTILVVVVVLFICYLAFNSYMRARIRAQRRRRRQSRRRSR